ncbi:MAG: hypothetical protein ACQEXO_12835, partial [Pseudomonadota bacterium]
SSAVSCRIAVIGILVISSYVISRNRMKDSNHLIAVNGQDEVATQAVVIKRRPPHLLRDDA